MSKHTGYEEEEELWSLGRWSVVRDLRAGGRIKLVDVETGWTDWPIWYGKYATDGVHCGKDINHHRLVATDHPERFPDYLLDVFRILQDESSLLTKVRLQIATMVSFIDQFIVPNDPKNHGLLWWAGDLPSMIWAYDPDEWRDGRNWPIEKIWDLVLGNLKSLGMDDVLAKARKLPIDDALNVKSMSDIRKERDGG